MKVIELEIEGVKLIEPTVYHDERGFSWKVINKLRGTR